MIGLKPSAFTFAIAAFIIGASFVGVIDDFVAQVLVGLLGFASFAEVRTWIDSQGYKTYVVAALGIIGIIVGSLYGLDPVAINEWMIFWGVIAAGTLTHGLYKAKKEGKGLIAKRGFGDAQ